jgi:hypothetical protein
MIGSIYRYDSWYGIKSITPEAAIGIPIDSRRRRKPDAQDIPERS